MRRLKVFWRSALASRVLEELETWASVLLALGAALLLYATLGAPPDVEAASGTLPGTWLRSLTLGEEFSVERPDGAPDVYEVAALDVVYAERAELPVHADPDTLVLVTCWPFDAVDVAGNWRYVVTARRVLRSEPAAAVSRTLF